MDDLTPTERAALVMYLLLQRKLTTSQVARRVAVTRQGAWALLTRISRVVPIRRNEYGEWEVTTMSKQSTS